jgi:Flp pilus assembly protein TadG
VLVETALILPIFVLLLLAGIDILRFFELDDRVNQAVDLIAKHYAYEEILIGDDFYESLLLAEKIVTENRYSSILSLQISALSIGPSSGNKVFWTRSISNGEITCSSRMPEFPNFMEEKTESFKVSFFIITTLCAKPVKEFFFTSIFTFENLNIRSQGVAVATSSAIRNLE